MCNFFEEKSSKVKQIIILVANVYYKICIEKNGKLTSNSIAKTKRQTVFFFNEIEDKITYNGKKKTEYSWKLQA